MRALTLIAAALALAACESGGGASDAGGRTDARVACVESEQPPPSDECIPNRCGNSRGVGMTCSPGGRECMANGFDNAFLCTVDLVPGADLNICTMACVRDEQCGEGAVCTGDPDDPAAGRGCVPAPCAPSGDDDAGVSDGDAGAPDGAVEDAGALEDAGAG